MMIKKIYIIHGWTYSIKPWTPVVSILKSRGYKIVQLKVPGLTTKSTNVFTIKDYVNWLNGEIGNEDKPIVIGHSNGGRIALNYLNKYPASFSKLILIGSAGVFDDKPKISLKRRIFKILSHTFHPLAQFPLVRKVVYKILGVKDYNLAPTNMKKTLSNILESDKELKIQYRDVPTFLIWGEKDQDTPLSHGKEMQNKIKGSKLIIQKEWGHAPYITHPYELANTLTEILEVKK